MRKHNVDEIHLSVDKVEIVNDTVIISWSSDIGFGEYEICWSEEVQEWCAYTECMDRDDDKAFGAKLLALWMEQIKIRD